MDEILQKYEVRKSNKEKTAFISYMKDRLGRLGYDVKVEEKGKGILKSRNIIVGDVKEAQVVLTAHYDTCAVLPFPNIMAPTSVLLFSVYQVLIVLFFIVFSIGLAVLTALLTGNSEASHWLVLAFFYAFLFHMLFGYRNKHTANDNTSGIVVLTKILENISEEDRNEVCVVYFDNEEKGLLGSSFFKDKHKKEMKEKLLINFDCIGDGNTIIALAKNKTQQDPLYKEFLDTMRQQQAGYDGEFKDEKLRALMCASDQMHFEKGVCVCALRTSALGMYVARIHTPWDTICREENLEYISDGVITFLRGIERFDEKCE